LELACSLEADGLVEEGRCELEGSEIGSRNGSEGGRRAGREDVGEELGWDVKL